MSLHQVSNDNGVRIVNLATSKILVVKSMIRINTFISTHFTSLDEKTQKRFDHIMIDRRQH